MSDDKLIDDKKDCCLMLCIGIKIVQLLLDRQLCQDVLKSRALFATPSILSQNLIL